MVIFLYDIAISNVNKIKFSMIFIPARNTWHALLLLLLTMMNVNLNYIIV